MVTTLYILSTIPFLIDWVFVHGAFIEHGGIHYSVFTALDDNGPWWRVKGLVGSITGGMSTLLVDITIACLFMYSIQPTRTDV